MLRFEFSKPFQILIKTSNAVEYIELNIKNTERLKTNYHIIYYKLKSMLTRFTWGVLKAIQVFKL